MKNPALLSRLDVLAGLLPSGHLALASGEEVFLDVLIGEIQRLRNELSVARGDAKILAHAYERGTCRPVDVISRALAYLPI